MFLFAGGLFASESKVEKIGLDLQKEKKYDEAIGCFTEIIVSVLGVYLENLALRVLPTIESIRGVQTIP